MHLIVQDHSDYHQLAVNLLDHAAFSQASNSTYAPTLWRTPGYPVFIALVYVIGGRSHMALGIAQYVLLWLSSLILYFLASKYVNRPAATIAAFLLATYPPLVFFAPLYCQETISTLLALLIVLGFVNLIKAASPPLWGALILGGGLGVLGLIRPQFVPMIGCIVVALILTSTPSTRRQKLAVSVLVISACTIIAPWMVRSSLIAGRKAGLGVGGRMEPVHLGTTIQG